MSTKDLLDRLENPKGGVRKPAPAPEPVAAPESRANDTRVATGVVRRRATTPEPPPPPAAPKTIRRPGAGRDEPPRAAPSMGPPSAVTSAPSHGIGASAQMRRAPPPGLVEGRGAPPVRREAPAELRRPTRMDPDAELVVNDAGDDGLQPNVPPVSAESTLDEVAYTPAAEDGPSASEPPGSSDLDAGAAPTEPPAPAPVERRAEPTMERAVIVERPGSVARPGAPILRSAGGALRLPEGPMVPGLGRAVVALPPGFDPSDPGGARRRAREATPAAPRWGPGAPPAGPRREARAEAPRPATPAAPQPSAEELRAKKKLRSKERSELVLDGMAQARMRRGKAKPGRDSGRGQAARPQIRRKIRVEGELTVASLAHELGIKATELVRALLALGQPATINEVVDIDTATLLAADYNAEIVNVSFDESEHMIKSTEVDEARISRPPVVTVMGHVDHGKTTLLDTIRKARVASGEAGGITQHVGAYQVKRGDQLITFIDTPGHAAFSAMRARGAKVTDVVVLVVAADDGVMPQTVEAISHSKAAKVPIVVAVNKCDKPGIQPERIRQMLMEYGLVPEEFGGDTMFANISALRGTGIEELLDAVLLQAEVLDLRANPERHAQGVVLESRLETGKGAVASLLVQNGTLKQGDTLVIGSTWGRVRAMSDDRGGKVKTAGPAAPVEIFGLQDLPTAGDEFVVVESERDARTLVEHRQHKDRTAALAQRQKVTVDDLYKLGARSQEVLHLILKTDVTGSLEALKSALEGIQVSGTRLKILLAGVGPITESDVTLAAAEDAQVIAFNVKADAKARQAADSHNVEIRRFDIIYNVIDAVRAQLGGLLAPVYEERRSGEAEVRATFSIAKLGLIAGCMVTEGKVVRGCHARIYRLNKMIHEGKVASLKRFKDDAKEVEKGFECGVGVEGASELLIGDKIAFFVQVEVPRVV